MNLKILNELKPNVLQYLPYGVTTLEIKIDGDIDELIGYICPFKIADRQKKLFVGFADESEDFLYFGVREVRQDLSLQIQMLVGDCIFKSCIKENLLIYKVLLYAIVRQKSQSVT